MSEFSVGQIVRINESDIEGTIRYVGETKFSPGPWVGVELVSEDGKNDGSVEGIRYFDCEMFRGIFVRPANVQLSHSSSKKLKNGTKRVSRPSSISSTYGRRLSHVLDPTTENRSNINASSPSPAGRPGSQASSILRSPNKSPIKSPAKQNPGVMIRTPSLTRNSLFYEKAATASASKNLQSKNAIQSHASMPPPPRPKINKPTVLTKSTPGRGTTVNKSARSRPSIAPKFAPKAGQRVGSISSQLSSGSIVRRSSRDSTDDMVKSPAESEDLSSQTISPVLSWESTPSNRIMGNLTTAAIEKNKSPMTQRSNNTVGTAAARTIEDLETKIRVMEKRAIENRDKLKTLEKVQEEKEKFEAIIQKIQIKYQPYQKENMDLRRQVKEAEVKFEEIEKNQAEYDLALEMATLDREMAEETAEVLKAELDAMKLKNEELELEVEVLREENTELGSEMSPEEKSSKGWLQMERNNERMREALIRLRDMTQQTEMELRDEIKSLQQDLQGLSSVKVNYELTKDKLLRSEAAVEDLKQQLDNAIGAETMIEELAEKNMAIQEEVEELKATVTDFEILKEISDEVEINHVEIEKDMQNEIDFKENIILEQKRLAIQQDQALSDMEYTLSRFRELVSNLQSDLDDLRASHAITETEAEQLNSRSRAMLDFNMKLQVSVAKTQLKTIDLELQRLGAQEALEHLEIVQLFLPDAFSTDRDSILAYLRFKRVGYKARILHGFLKEKVNPPSAAGHEDDIFAACDVLDKLSRVAALCDRFVKNISYCSIAEFSRYQGALYDLEPVERALCTWIDSLRKDEFKEKQCGSELQRLISLMSHLADVHLSSSLESYANEVYMKSVIMQSQLENAAIVMISTKQMVEVVVSNQGEADELTQDFSRKFDALTSQIRGGKVIIGKAVRALEDLNTRSLSLTPDTLASFKNAEDAIEELAKFSRLLGHDLFEVLYDENRAEPCTCLEVQSTMNRTTSKFYASNESEFFSLYTSKLRTLITSLTDLATLASDLELTQEFERAPAPWLLRSQELKALKTVPVDTEEEIHRLKDLNLERARLIAIKDQALEETSVKIELLQSRMRDATKKNERITELEHSIKEAKKREKELTESLDSQNEELITLETDREKWRKIAEDVKSLGVIPPGSKIGQEEAVATAREIEILTAEIASLQATVRFLREENCRMKQLESQDIDWLKEPLIKPITLEGHRNARVFSEGQDVLGELLNLSVNSHIYDFKTTSQNRLGWRPAKSTPQYHIAKQKEDYTAWKSWKDDVVQKVKTLEQCHTLPRLERISKVSSKKAAEVKLSLPDWSKKTMGHDEVTIVEPDDFESFRGSLGFV
ncbi:Dynactin, isoform [Podosphaera aphanis]|nr:Dynactin, isoform [Podosphaera aphanis]